MLDSVCLFIVAFFSFQLLRLVLFNFLEPSRFYNPLVLWLALMIFRDFHFSLGSLNYKGIGKRIFKLQVKDAESGQEINPLAMFLRNYFFFLPILYLLLFSIVVKPFYDLTLGKLFALIFFMMPKGDYFAFYHMFSFAAWVLFILVETLLMFIDRRTGDRLANSEVTSE